MVFKSPTDKAFHAAFIYEIHHQWNKRQKALATESGTSISFISDIKNGRANASFKKQKQIAEASGYTWEEFIERGRTLIENGEEALSESKKLSVKHKKRPPLSNDSTDTKTIEQIANNQQIIEKFNDKVLAKQIIEKLLELETLDSEELHRVLIILKDTIKDLKTGEKPSKGKPKTAQPS